ncbi:MAG: insulinase family protein, partial [Eggerthellaceae bacterium]|nr:insulinase family protein [Eggerthellaceae bacterium]
TNEQDLLNLMDVYMDAVFNPRIYVKEGIFKQEGWHFEMEDAQDALRYNGVVFNEMKGALSDPDIVLYDSLCAALFPNSAYAFESGGDPTDIPHLSYEDFLDTHTRHYRLDNSFIFLYGDMEVERELAFLDEKYLSVVQSPPGLPNPLVIQEPRVEMNLIKEMPTAQENACLGVAYVTGTIHERKRNIALDILTDAIMGSNEAPLKRALLDSQIADDAHGFFVAEQLQPMLILQMKGVAPGKRNTFLRVVEETVGTLVREGIPKERLEASLSRAEFSIRERDFGIADGVVLGIQAMTGWLYDDQLACAYLRYEDAFADMRARIDSGYFEALLKEVVLESQHKACVEIIAVEELDEEKEAARLAEIKSGLCALEIEQIITQAKTLHSLQEEPDSPEALASLPMLGLGDIKDMRAYPAYRLIDSTSTPCLYHEIPTRQIDYIYHYFNLDRLHFDELPYLGVLLCLLGKLDTEKHKAGELDSLMRARLGTLRFFVEVYGDEKDPALFTPKLVVSASSLAKNIGYLAGLPQEVFSSTLFENTGKIKDILLQNRNALEQDFVNSGHSAALSRLSSYYTPAAQIREQVSGIDFYRFIKELLASFDERAEELVARLYAISRRLFVGDGAISSFTGSEAELDAFWEAFAPLGHARDGAEGSLVVPQACKRNEAFIVPSDVCFAASGYDRRCLGIPYSGTWQVVGRILSLDYLWQELRVKGGAYGGGFKADRDGNLQFYSYRDPNLDATLACFDATAAWLAGFNPDKCEMTGYIISSVAGYDAPKKPREIARSQDGEFFRGMDADWRERARNEVLATTAADIRAFAPVFESLSQQGARCVFGNQDIIGNAGAALDTIRLLS